MSSENTISSSKKEIYSKLLEVGKKYIKDTDTDFLKTGLFGYITESMAMMMRDSTFHKSMVYNESFLNTAIIPKSVYNWAKMFNIEIQKASPAYADINIEISATSILTFLKDDINNFPEERDKFGNYDLKNYIILDRDCPIIAGDYYFSLDHSIVITYTSGTGENSGEVFKARYMPNSAEKHSTNFGNLTEDYIPVLYNGGNILIKARAFQYKQTIFTEQIASDTFLNKVKKYNFDDQFCGVKLFYKDIDGSLKEVALKYSDLSLTSTTEKVAYYNITDENEIELIFKHGDNFYLPISNSKIFVYIYTTKGTNINKKFTGTALMMLSDPALKALPISITFADSLIIGGKNTPSLSEIKDTIINEISTRNVITTASDLNNYFMILTHLIEDINDGKVSFVKKRDDVLKRIFNTYLLLRDNMDDTTEDIADETYISSCVPTNTIDVLFYDENTMKEPTLEFKSTDENDKLTTALNNVILKYPKFTIDGDYLGDTSIEGEEYYISPFYIYLIDDTIRSVKYIYNMCNQTSILNYNNDNDTHNRNYSFVVSTDEGTNQYYITPISVNIERGFSDNGMSAADAYTITLTLNTNFQLSNSVESIKDGIFKLNPNGKLKVYIDDFTTSESVNPFEISAQNITLESVESESKNTYNTTLKFNIAVASTEFKMSEFCNKIYLKDENGNSIGVTNNKYFAFDLSGLTIANEKTSINYSFKSYDKIKLFSNLDEIMESGFIWTDAENHKKELAGLTEVPVVHSSFFKTNSENRKKGFVTQLFRYIDTLQENLDRLETTTFFNMKFYNTYGYSKLYNTPTTNIELLLNIELVPDYKDNEKLIKEIRAYIRKIVDSMNNSAAGVKVSTITAMLASVNTYGKYIDHIDFMGLNGSFSQFIDQVKDFEKLSIQCPPEWLNLDPETLETCIKFS